ncbi:hypothetical protein R3P38DRAFT_3332812 [Favolaschia claudopus]|uniref:RRM domain-containing protein n=1 Tax=Favolaschia claudopus TaxID=2862362 RepID=A0AAV9ZJR7_9AGAR
MSPALPVPVADSGALLVTNLTYRTTDDGLRTFFEPVSGDILSVHIVQRGTRSAGYGFVALRTEAAAQKAIELLDKKDLDGRNKVCVDVAKTPEEKPKETEKKAKTLPGRRGTKAIEEVEKVVCSVAPCLNHLKPSIVGGGGALTASETTSAEGRGLSPAREDHVTKQSKTMLFVANLDFSIDDAGLSALFTDAGINVVSARVPRRGWGHHKKSKGYGFVDVGGEQERNKAIQALQGMEVRGRTIDVRIAVTHHGDAPPKTVQESVASLST